MEMALTPTSKRQCIFISHSICIQIILSSGSGGRIDLGEAIEWVYVSSVEIFVLDNFKPILCVCVLYQIWVYTHLI